MTKPIYIIEEVQIVPIKPNNGLVGFASCVFEKSFYLGGMGIYTRPGGGYRIAYPTKSAGNKGNINIYHPIKGEVAQAIEDAVADKYEELMLKDYHGD